VLDRNPENFFAEVEQAAFAPGHFVPGVTQLPVNAPRGVAEGATNYGRDGAMRFDGNSGRAKNYEPNSFDGPKQTGEPLYAGLSSDGASGTYAAVRHAGDDDFVQAGMRYRVMDEAARQRLVDNVAGGLARVTQRGIVERSVAHFRAADPEYGSRLEAALKERRG
jgi:catalase